MKIGIVITARLGSTRLKRKHLLDVGGKPILSYLLARVNQEFKEEVQTNEILPVIATSDEMENREFERFVSYGFRVFYGSTNNIPLRHLQVAKSYNLDSVISVDGDDILCSIRGMRLIYGALTEKLPYVKTCGLPFGMNATGYSRGFLKSSLVNHYQNVLETGWGRIFDKGKLVDINIQLGNYNATLRFTLDYMEDFYFFKSIIDSFGDDIFAASDEEIIDLVIEKQLFKINESIAKRYWSNYHENLKREDLNDP